MDLEKRAVENKKLGAQISEQKITAIKGRIAEGTPWAARNENSVEVWFYTDKPLRIDNRIFALNYTGISANIIYDFITLENSPVYLPDLIEGE